MLKDLEDIIIASLQTAGFSPYSDFSKIDTFDFKEDYIAFYTTGDINYSDKFYSFDNSEYGISVSGSVEIKAFGCRNRYRDSKEFDAKCSSLINNLISSDKIVISNLKQSRITADYVLRRLKSVIILDFTALINKEIKE